MSTCISRLKDLTDRLMGASDRIAHEISMMLMDFKQKGYIDVGGPAGMLD